jgi:3-isopropylmalate dehydrogenase
MKVNKIAVIAGDGIGPEVIREALLLLKYYAVERGFPLELWELDLGADRYLRDGVTLPPDVRMAIEKECAAVLLGALGDPRIPGLEHARDILFGLRFGLDLYANVRPVKALADRLVPLKNRGKDAVDFVVFRENTEGAYAGIGGQLRRGTSDEIAISEDINTRRGVERILRAAFEHARKTGRRRVHMADKSNAMPQAHGLWRRTFDDVMREYPDIEARAVYIDALCLYLIQEPDQFEVIVTNNLFGDIVTDLGAGLQGGLGMAASANLHAAMPDRVALFEPVHGSAPEIAGKNLANPFAAFLTVGLLLDHLGWPQEALRIEQAVTAALEAGQCTRDVGGLLGTDAAGEAVRGLLRP